MRAVSETLPHFLRGIKCRPDLSAYVTRPRTDCQAAQAHGELGSQYATTSSPIFCTPLAQFVDSQSKPSSTGGAAVLSPEQRGLGTRGGSDPEIRTA